MNENSQLCRLHIWLDQTIDDDDDDDSLEMDANISLCYFDLLWWNGVKIKSKVRRNEKWLLLDP